MSASSDSQNGSSVASTANGTSSSNFTQIPVLSLAKARDPSTKPEFLIELLDALLHVGFLYLGDTGVPKDLVDQVCAQTRLFFDESVLSLDDKEKIEMKNEKSFLGWSRVSDFLRYEYECVV
jgi:isopenicillin N synthase-like dioxygenase